MRSIVLSDDISDLTDHEKNFDEYDIRKLAKDEIPNDSTDERSDYSKFDSQASRINFWKDIH